MGRVGSGAYDALTEHFAGEVVGFDVNIDAVSGNLQEGRNVVLASATDPDFWERLHIERERIELVFLAMSSHAENLGAIELLRAGGYPGLIAASARYQDEVDQLRKAGADVALHVLAEAGRGLVDRALSRLRTGTSSLPAPPAATSRWFPVGDPSRSRRFFPATPVVLVGVGDAADRDGFSPRVR
jgi:Trk K+ transport system NAD-binding subunit